MKRHGKKLVGFTGPRQPGAHGKTLEMNALRRPAPEYIVQYGTKAVKRGKRSILVKDGEWTPHTNPNKDRSLSGKARRRARRAPREVVAGFLCSCGARATLTASATEQDREWFDGLYDAHEGCEVSV